MNLKRILTMASFLFLILAITSCASSVGVTEYEPGFFTGLWDGFRIIYSLIGSIYDSSINLIAENNSGFFYYLGWIIGIIIAIPVELISLYLIFSLVFNKD